MAVRAALLRLTSGDKTVDEVLVEVVRNLASSRRLSKWFLPMGSNGGGGGGSPNEDDELLLVA